MRAYCCVIGSIKENLGVTINTRITKKLVLTDTNMNENTMEQ